MAKRDFIPEGSKRKNFVLSEEILEMLKELAKEENSSEVRIVENSIKAYFIGTKMQKAMIESKSFDSEAFAKSLGNVLLEGLKRENLVVPAESLKTE